MQKETQRYGGLPGRSREKNNTKSCMRANEIARKSRPYSIERFEKNRNGGTIYIKTRPKPFPCKKTIKLKSARRKNRFDVFPVPPLLFRPCYFAPLFRPRYFAPAISRKQDDKKSKKKKLSHTLKPNCHGKGHSEVLKQKTVKSHKTGALRRNRNAWIAARL